MNTFSIRKAIPEDTPIILDLIRQLAIYEELEHEFVATEATFKESVFDQNHAEVLIASEGEKVVGFALYFFNFSTFVGKSGLYLEDLFIDVEYRGKGYGKKILIELAKIANAKNCGRMEWSVLDWNVSAIAFYKSLQSKPMNGWTVFRLTASEIDDLANQ